MVAINFGLSSPMAADHSHTLAFQPGNPGSNRFALAIADEPSQAKPNFPSPGGPVSAFTLGKRDP